MATASPAFVPPLPDPNEGIREVGRFFLADRRRGGGGDLADRAMFTDMVEWATTHLEGFELEDVLDRIEEDFPHRLVELVEWMLRTYWREEPLWLVNQAGDPYWENFDNFFDRFKPDPTYDEVPPLKRLRGMGWQDVDNSEDAWMDDYDYDDPNDPVMRMAAESEPEPEILKLMPLPIPPPRPPLPDPIPFPRPGASSPKKRKQPLGYWDNATGRFFPWPN